MSEESLPTPQPSPEIPLPDMTNIDNQIDAIHMMFQDMKEGRYAISGPPKPGTIKHELAKFSIDLDCCADTAFRDKVKKTTAVSKWCYSDNPEQGGILVPNGKSEYEVRKILAARRENMTTPYPITKINWDTNARRKRVLKDQEQKEIARLLAVINARRYPDMDFAPIANPNIIRRGIRLFRTIVARTVAWWRL